jgi:hypothetical protein
VKTVFDQLSQTKNVLFNEIKITAVCISPYIWALVCNYEHLYKFLNSTLISKAEPQMFILFFEQMPRLVVMVGVIIEQITKKIQLIGNKDGFVNAFDKAK